MGRFKQDAIAAMESGKKWGALELDREHMIPEMLHDKDKPWMQGSIGAHGLEAEVQV